MPKKSSPKEILSEYTRLKKINLSRDLIKTMFENSKNRHHFDQIGYPPGPFKSLIKPASSRPCIHNKPTLHLQLTIPDVTVPTITGSYYYESHTWAFPIHEPFWNLTREDNRDVLAVTNRVSKADRQSWIYGQKRRWIKHEITTADPYDSKNEVMKVTNVIECNGKSYVLSMHGSLVVMEESHDDRLVIRGVSKSRAVPSVSARYFKECLIESRGEILLVFLIYRETIDTVDEIEVFRLDLARLDLVKVDRLQGRTFFLESEYSLWVDTREIGCKGDCVYFFDESGGRWWMYDMESRSISMNKPQIEY